mmetsp:Transcript_88816/g.198599  ORF Transcript_88816/g.198599 Transcript_88816/m.198599 type:complete len:275 (+) Transcript_88816:975-1799(+)
MTQHADRKRHTSPPLATETVCCSMASCTAARSWLRTVENSSMQQAPPSARTRAPASKDQSGPSRTAAQVRPAALQPRPLVRTLRPASSWAACSNCDLPVPGSPSKRRWGVTRICPPSSPVLFGAGTSTASGCGPAAELAEAPGAFRKRSQREFWPLLSANPLLPNVSDCAPPMSVSKRPNFGTGSPRSQGAVTRMISARAFHSSPQFLAQNCSNSSFVSGLTSVKELRTGESRAKRSTLVASTKSSISSFLPCHNAFHLWQTTPSNATVSPGWT